MLEALGLECVRGQRRLFQGLSFDLPAGQMLWVLGPNGSGKTSLLRLLCGLLRPEAGNVLWKGADVRRSPETFHADLLYLGHAPAVKDDLSSRENLCFGLAQMGIGVTPHEADSVLGEFGLSSQEVTPARALSQGQRRRAALARLAFGATRPLWVLDEPFTALDSQAVRLVRSHLAQQRTRGGCVVFTSHQEVDLAGHAVKRIQLAQ
jgi:heme exporter protein A